MSLADDIKSRLDTGRKRHEVPELGEEGKPLVLYATEITGKDLKYLQRKHKDFFQNQTLDGMVDLIILKAELEDGSKAFTLEDKQTILGFSINVLSNLSGKMFGDFSNVEELEKN